MPRTVTEIEQRVESILRNFTRLDALKTLFWSELNFERMNTPLPCPDALRSLLVGDPLLFATEKENGDFHVIFCHLAHEKLSLGTEREIVSHFLRQHPYALFVFANRAQTAWHFVNVKPDAQHHNRLVVRRIAAGQGEQVRTATERLALLDLENVPHGLFGVDAAAIQQRCDTAFDVEAVTQKFFKEYHRVFDAVEAQISGLVGDDLHLFTQRLFNRLMFIAFIQKKGWLKIDEDTDYLDALWASYLRANAAETASNFYDDRLKPLFFMALNTGHEVNVLAANPHGFIQSLVGDVPYLNGGLFEDDELDKRGAIGVPDAAIKLILHELFGRFNFTVTESTPLDIEVAVDPEMLGKVFEELVTGRHESGSYYTPKPVVAFMGREALKGYLEHALPLETPAAIAQFVDGRDPHGLRDPQNVLDALRRMRICDPACGSGAYLLGMLHELLELRETLFKTKSLDPVSVYERKLEIIERNIYGVDKEQFAINIARLRLWLSLAVDLEGQPLPLPNLDFKIEQGDSLTVSLPQGFGQLALQEDLIRQYKHSKSDYLNSHGEEKKKLLLKVSNLEQQISDWAGIGNKQVNGFDWQVKFAEVFADNGGFDVVLANPPYVRADAKYKNVEGLVSRQGAVSNWKKYRELLVQAKIYQTIYEKWDLYIPFLERAFQILTNSGQMVFIIPDAYNSAKYTSKSHEYFIRTSTIRRIDFCSEIFLFNAGVNNTILHFSKDIPSKTHMPLRVRRWGNSPDDFQSNYEILPSELQAAASSSIFRSSSNKINISAVSTTPLSYICFISKGMVINSDEDGFKGAFKVDDLLSITEDDLHCKKFVLGKDLSKWCSHRIRYIEWNSYRSPHQFSRPSFPEFFEVSEKLISMRTPGEHPRVIYDNRQIFFDASSVGMVSWHALNNVRNRSISKSALFRDEMKTTNEKELPREELEKISTRFSLRYILGLLNSDFSKKWLNSVRRSKMHIYPDDWKQFPIANANLQDQEAIAALAQKCLDAKGVGCEAWEREIDERVARLYGVTLDSGQAGEE